MNAMPARAEPRSLQSLAAAKPLMDMAHLARMTLGERSLEREILQLFDRQSDILLARMRAATPTNVSGYAHTLKGSALGIGAWRIADAAEAVELASGRRAAQVKKAVDTLESAIGETRAAIAELLRAM